MKTAQTARVKGEADLNRRRISVRQIAGLTLIAAAYWSIARAGLLLTAQTEGVASVWPASGLALAALLLNPKRLWSKLLAVIFAVNLAVRLDGGDSLPVSLGFAFANVLEPFLAAWWLNRICGARVSFERVLEVFVLLGVAIFSNGITALIGAAVPALAWNAPFWRAWQVWLAANGLGMILIAPLIVTWTNKDAFRAPTLPKLIETTLLAVLVAAFSLLLFGQFTVAERPLLQTYIVFPLVIWLAFRYNPRGMTGMLSLLSFIAIWNTLHGVGAFAFKSQSLTQQIALLQIFLIVVNFSGLLLVAIIAERKAGEKALRESEERYHRITRAITNFVYSVRLADGRHEEATHQDEGCYAVTGYRADEFERDPQLWMNMVAEEDRPAVAEQTRIMLAGEMPPSIEYRIIRKDGSLRWVARALVPYRDSHGRLVAYDGSIRDITERKHAEEEIRRLNATLEQRVAERTRDLQEAQAKLVRQEKLAALGQMAGGVGHELRNPLGVISNAAYFLKAAQPEASEIVKEYLTIIEQNVRYSEKIVGDLLDFTRVKSLAPEPISVAEIVRQTLERFPPPETLAVMLELPADLPEAYADPQHVMQILGNLTLNACQAMLPPALAVPEKKVGNLTISSYAQGDMIVIEVRDTGCGIPPENMRQLFEPLFTTKSKGIGLGLAVSKKLVEANGGRIEAASETGIGSVFSVYLPKYRSTYER